jgi:hypothetical protein
LTLFEMKNTLGSEQAKAVMTERAMTVLFSHKLVNGIYAWTIMASGSKESTQAEEGNDDPFRFPPPSGRPSACGLRSCSRYRVTFSTISESSGVNPSFR